MAPYRILHIIGGGEIGGAEQHVLTLLNQLDRKRFFPVLACLIDGPFAKLARQNGLETKTFPMHWALDLSPLPALTRWARSQGISLLHAHGSRANLLGRLAAQWLKLPSVSTVHSSLAHDYLSSRAAHWAIILDRLTLPLSSGQIAVSHYLAAEIKSRGGKNIRIIHNGLPALPILNSSEQKKAVRRRWNIPLDALVLGNIARFHPTKGQRYLVEAATRLSKDFPKLHVMLIGEGPSLQEIREELQEKNIPYTLPGFLPDAYKALPAMDLFVLPSLSEGMGLVLLEAMQAGVPIVASAVGGIPEVVRHGQDGLLVPPGDPTALAKTCASLLLHPALTKALTLSAAQRWQEFTPEKMVAQTEDFYDDILNRRNKAR
ncbi:MAG: glycosyltransferase [Desulfitobacteriaceae bacterium]